MTKRCSWILLVVALAGCSGETAPSDTEPHWLSALPNSQTEHSANDLVLAMIPRAGLPVEIRTFRVVGGDGSSFEVADDIGNTYSDVPGALLHAIGSGISAGPGDILLADLRNAHHLVGRVLDSESDERQGMTVAFDWNGQTVVKRVVAALPL